MKTFNKATTDQLTGIILLDCIDQCNRLLVPQAEYELNLKAMLRERLGTTGQREMVV